jgi:hypothetical protein
MEQSEMDSWNFLVGALLVASWASRAFQSPNAAGYIRERTDSQRYVIGLAVFVLGDWMVYVLLWNMTRRIHDDFGLLERISGLFAVAATVILLPTVSRTNFGIVCWDFGVVGRDPLQQLILISTSVF